MATIAVPAVTMSEPLLAIAGPASKGVAASTALSDATDFSSVHRRRYYRGGGSAAGLAFFGMAIGTIGAQQQRYDHYNSYGYGPGYYGGGPYYYGGGPYYGRRYDQPYSNPSDLFSQRSRCAGNMRRDASTGASN